MSCHPCADHMDTCNHCYLCDVVGVCCMTAPAPTQAAVSQSDGLTILREVLSQDDQSRPNLTNLIQADAATSPGLADLIQSDVVWQIVDRPVPVRFVRSTAAVAEKQAILEPGPQPALPPASTPDPIFQQTHPTQKEKEHAHNHTGRLR
jgi:hypothetical protein